MKKKWWMESVGYQIYPKSFYDANHDGYGDLLGIYEKLPYLKLLGINLIWICPFYDSPMDDNGYDVRDYFKINPLFGTMVDFKLLLKRAKELEIRVILDFVLNHTSDEHPWFVESRKSLNNPYRDYYIWRKGKIINGVEVPPTNWGSFFGGSAWKKDSLTNEYYMKIFSDKMPDLNWKNDRVIDEMINIGKYWLDLGVDGFRIDAVSHLEKAPFEDSNLSKNIILDWTKFSNLPNMYKYLKTLNARLFKHYDALTIGEVGGEANIESAYQFAAFDADALSMAFNFDHNWCNNLHDINQLKDLKIDLVQLKRVFNKWQTAFKDRGWLPLNWLNHDQPRLLSHYGNVNYRDASAKMLATALYLMRGTPFIYQGEEIGMTNYPFKKLKDFEDASSIYKYHCLKKSIPNHTELMFKVSSDSRDNARTAMQWSSNANAGFSEVIPKVKINPNYVDVNVENNLNDKYSIFYHYHEIIKLRTNSIYKNTILYGDYHQIDENNPNLYIYTRTDLQYIIYVISSFSDQNVTYHIGNLEFMTIISNNYQTVIIKNDTIELMPYQAVAIVQKRSIL